MGPGMQAHICSYVPRQTLADPAHVLGRRLLFNFRNVRNGEGGGGVPGPTVMQNSITVVRGGGTQLKQ